MIQIEHRPANPLNYSERRGSKIDMIVIHTTQGPTAQSAINWFADPDAHASAHYVISPEGKIYRCVDDTKNAWHAGNGPYNRRSIGIECAGDCYHAKMWTPELVAALHDLCRDICKRLHIPADREHIIGHDRVPNPKDPTKFGGANGHVDPGKHFDWTALYAALEVSK
jgi:N-acetyl-anhydromuramyl-L-alanine amidase AmpD